MLFPNTGGLALYRYDGKGPVFLKESPGVQIGLGETVHYRITVTKERIKIERADGKASIEVDDAAYRGAYVTFGAKGQQASFSAITLTMNR